VCRKEGGFLAGSSNQFFTVPADVRFPLVRWMDRDRLLLVDTRTDGGRENAFVFTLAGEEVRRFCAGDGVQDVLVAGDRIVMTYFDEGVFGNVTPSDEGLAVFSADGRLAFGSWLRAGVVLEHRKLGLHGSIRPGMKRALFGAWRMLAGLARPSRSRNRRRLRARGETAASLKIREATVTDIPALARVHVATWNATYAPFLMKGPSYEVRERQWRDGFARSDAGWFCFVVQRPDGELVGFAQGNRGDHPEFAGELNKIYLLREYQRLGLGRRLLGHVARTFLRQGIDSMWLYGDARNPSNRAWKALGAEKTDRDPGNGNYGWHDLRGLAALPE
jgi:ribosomal protein S18 acetylase RimI-like enzyme